MKSFKDMYHNVYSFENLIRAHYKCRQGKRDKPEVVHFEDFLNSNIAIVKDELINDVYFPGRYKFFIQKTPKRRIIMYFPYRDRIVQSSFCTNVLAPIIVPGLINDNYASIKGRGTHLGVDRFKCFLRDYYNKHGADGWVLKADISKYFYSINHEILKSNLYPRIKDERVKGLLDKYIDSTNEDYVQKILMDNYIDLGIPKPRPGKGLTVGNEPSQYLAVFHLDKVDKLCKETLKIRYYSRYMDDFVLIHQDREYLKYCLEEIIKALDELDLKLNPKTQIFPLKNGTDYLGWHFYLTDSGKVVMKLRKKSKDNMKRKVKLFRNLHDDELIEVDRIKQSVASWEGHAKHGNTYNLRQHILEPVREIII